jgi:uncharacterized protein (TIGR02001 family)
LSNGKPAVQGALLLEHHSGAYAEVWASTLGSPRGAVDSEWDFSAGYEAALTEKLSLDLYATYVAYPKAGDESYVEATAIASAELGTGSASLGASFVPRQRGTRDEDGRGRRNFYLFVEGAYAIPKTPLSLTARAGRERGWFDDVERGGKWDWSVSAQAEVHSARLGIAYSGSNADSDRHGIIASLFLAW